MAAALLVLGVSAGLANLDVRYDRNGSSVRTGWSKPLADGAPQADRSACQSQDAAHGVRELAALEQQLRSEIRASPASTSPVSAYVDAARAGAGGACPDADADAARARACSTRASGARQRELALRVGEVMRDSDSQRQADLVKIDRNLGVFAGQHRRRSAEQPAECSTYILQRVSQQTVGGLVSSGE